MQKYLFLKIRKFMKILKIFRQIRKFFREPQKNFKNSYKNTRNIKIQENIEENTKYSKKFVKIIIMSEIFLYIIRKFKK